MQNHSNAVVLWKLKLRGMSTSSETTDSTAFRRIYLKKYIYHHVTLLDTQRSLTRLITTTIHYMHLYPIVSSRPLVFRGHPYSLSVECWVPVRVAARPKACVGGHSPAGVTSSNPARGMDDCLLWVLCVLPGRGVDTGWSLVQRSPTECGESNPVWSRNVNS
jgi:hypothetical protein